MRTRQEVPAAILRLARQQAGVVSRPQVFDAGVSRTVLSRLVADGRWGRLDRGIYRVPDVPASWLGLTWAGVLLGGDGARVGGRAAAVLNGLELGEPLPIEVLVPFGRHLTHRDWVRFVQERDRVRGRSTRAEPPRIRVEDTVLDLCADATDKVVVDLLTSAVQRGLTSCDAVQAALDRRRIAHRPFLQALLLDIASGVHSGLELGYLQNVERAHGLPDGRRQRARPGRTGYLDVLYEQYALVVELDGRVGHVGEGRWRDRRRDNVHTRAGLRTLRFGWHEVTHQPCEVAVEVAEVLIGVGWPGYPGRCPRCR